MKIEVAGAGAGKTTKTASHILDIDIPDGKIVYCITFTNAAADNIRTKFTELNGFVPSNVKISTIHSFLYTELIKPYYHLLFGTRYEKISVIQLQDDCRYRNVQIRELEEQRLLHQTVIPKRAKWVVDKRSQDKAITRSMRKKILAIFASYCHAIIVDEAQDISDDIRDVLLALNNSDVEIMLTGDPKQDIKGHGCFREIIDMFPDNVSYRKECHRCPQMHLFISNRLACDEEKQMADATTCEGSIEVLFEADEDAAALIKNHIYGLAYICKKNDRFNTHTATEHDSNSETLRYELELAIRKKHGNSMTALDVKRAAYRLAGEMTAFVNGKGNVANAISKALDSGAFDYEKKTYARIAKSLSRNERQQDDAVIVKSIEAIKGLEHKKCLFILTRDLAPYLMGDKADENKTKHLLYVALTRSLDNLTILVTTEVETSYSRNEILTALGK